MKRLWLLFVALVTIAIGCQAQPALPTETPSPTATTEPTVPPPATSTPLPTPTITPTPFPTVTPPAEPLDRFEQAQRLGRGVNLGNALEAPSEGEWGMVLQVEYFQLIAEAGFDTVRVPIRWSAHAMAEPPYTIDEAFFERIDWVLENAFANGLNAVINMHHYDAFAEAPSAHRERFVAMWRQIAARYGGMPDGLYYEPLNEPYGQLTAGTWNAIVADAIVAIREVDKVHTLVIDGTDWANASALGRLGLPADETNAICTFHLYEPHMFTHQGAEWMDDTYGTIGVQWPGPPETPLTPVPATNNVPWIKKWFEDYNTQPTNRNPAGPAPILGQIEWAVRYAERLDCPLWLGEFGAYNKADLQSRVNWTSFVRQEAETRGISWAYWEFGADFGIYDRNAGQWNEELLRALIPDTD
jgi:endoglucanase